MTVAPFLVLAVLSLILILEIVPYYGWLYQIGLGLLGTIFLLLSPLAVLILFVNALYHRRWRQLLLVLGWALAIFLTWGYLLPLREPITARVIQTFYCGESHSGEQETVLGGIQRIGRTFVNDSHCILPMCREEFYYCDK